MSFSKRPGKNTPQCYTKPLDSLKNWNNRFFWVDDKVFPTVVAWRTGAPKDGMPPANSYSALDVTTLNTRRTPIQKQPELLLCLVGLSQRYFLGDDIASNPAKVKIGTRPRAAYERNHRCDEVEANAPPKVLRKDHVSSLAHSAYGGKSLARMGLGAGFISSTPSAQGAPTAAKSVSDPDPLSYAKPQPSSRGTATEIPTEHVATTEGIYQPGWGVTNDYRLDTPAACQDTVDHIAPLGYFSELCYLPDADFLSQYNINLARKVAMGSQLRLRFEQEVGLLKKTRAKIAKLDQRIQVREEEIKKLGQEVKSLRATETKVHGLRNQTKNLETLLEAEADMKKAAEAKNAKLTKELESLRVQFSDLQVNNNQLYQQVSNLQAQITGEEKIKATFEEFKKYEDARVEQRCAKIDARLDALSINFDEELYPHMLTAIAGHRWVIGHVICLVVMKCAKSTELRQVFANVVSAGIAKGMSGGLRYGIEHGKAGRDLVDVKAYDPEANDKLVKALQDLKDLKYPMVDQLERLKDAPMELIMTSLYLEDPWAVKEEMLLEDAITANISQAEKKKKCRVVCRTHGIGSDHHSRSNGILVSAPTVVPQGLAILLADAATQTKAADKEEEPHPRL
ncbi:hypothetical protein Tco_0148964 [Tanacetum coccineum]